jgi:hypothetical protein
MTEQRRQLSDIDTLIAMIQFDFGELKRRPLSADERRLIKGHLDTLISDYQTLLKYLGWQALPANDTSRCDGC